MTKLTIKEAVEKHKLDRRKKYFSFNGIVVYNATVSLKCSDCNGHGCFECRGKGKTRLGFPIPVITKNGELIKVKNKNFTYYKNN